MEGSKSVEDLVIVNVNVKLDVVEPWKTGQLLTLLAKIVKL
jgi:hypothetical protein